MFIAEVLNTPQYPFSLQGLLIAFDCQGPWDFKWAWWSSLVDSEISLFKIVDKKSIQRYEAWQAARGMLKSDLVSSYDILSFQYLNIMADGHQEILPDEYQQKLATELQNLRAALDARIPEFGIQLQSVLGRLQEQPEAAWKLTDEERKTIVEAFKQNANVTVFQAAKATSIKNHKIKGPISEDMF